jgi:hypothetical protein
MNRARDIVEVSWFTFLYSFFAGLLILLIFILEVTLEISVRNSWKDMLSVQKLDFHPD